MSEEKKAPEVVTLREDECEAAEKEMRLRLEAGEDQLTLFAGYWNEYAYLSEHEPDGERRQRLVSMKLDLTTDLAQDHMLQNGLEYNSNGLFVPKKERDAEKAERMVIRRVEEPA